MRLILFMLAGVLISGRAIAQESGTHANAKNEPAFTFVEQMPQFPGGDAALVSFIQKRVTYPAMERDNDIEGKVIVRFVIMEDGSIGDVEVTRKVSPGLDREAVRVVKMLPKFKPGMQEGKPVKVYFNMPVLFSLPGKAK